MGLCLLLIFHIITTNFVSCINLDRKRAHIPFRNESLKLHMTLYSSCSSHMSLQDPSYMLFRGGSSVCFWYVALLI